MFSCIRLAKGGELWLTLIVNLTQLWITWEEGASEWLSTWGWPVGTSMVPSLRIFTVIKYWQKPTWEGKGLFDLHIQLTIHPWGSQAGAETRTTEDAAYWPAFHDSLSLLSRTTQDRQPRELTTQDGLGPSTSVIHQENAPETHSRVNKMEIARLRLSPPGSLACAKLPKLTIPVEDCLHWCGKHILTVGSTLWWWPR